MESNLNVSATGIGTVGPTTFAPNDPNSLLYAAVVTTLGSDTFSGSPSTAGWTSTNGPTNSGNHVAGVTFNTANTYGPYGLGIDPEWSLTTGTFQGASVGVVLRAQQPAGYTLWNDPATSTNINAGVLSNQARPDYLDFVADGLAAAGTGVLNGCAVIASTGADYKVESLTGTVLFNSGTSDSRLRPEAQRRGGRCDESPSRPGLCRTGQRQRHCAHGNSRRGAMRTRSSRLSFRPPRRHRRASECHRG